MIHEIYSAQLASESDDAARAARYQYSDILYRRLSNSSECYLDESSNDSHTFTGREFNNPMKVVVLHSARKHKRSKVEDGWANRKKVKRSKAFFYQILGRGNDNLPWLLVPNYGDNQAG